MDRTKESIGVLRAAAVILVYVGIDITAARAPKALEKAENLGCLSETVAAGLT